MEERRKEALLAWGITPSRLTDAAGDEDPQTFLLKVSKLKGTSQWQTKFRSKGVKEEIVNRLQSVADCYYVLWFLTDAQSGSFLR